MKFSTIGPPSMGGNTARAQAREEDNAVRMGAMWAPADAVIILNT
jgi:hypothetical protein